MQCAISYRGGTLGFYGSDVANYLNIDPAYLPRNFGAYCNYLGGGLRGSVQASDYYNKLPAKCTKLLNALGLACVRVYIYLENGAGLNDSKYPDGNTNWEALGTQRCRQAGIKSAY